jgi:uncharacterized protein YeaO (DUF488 family)
MPGASASVRFLAAGDYPFYCAIHPTQMQGSITVQKPRRPLRTKRWCDPREPGDGLRLLICRYRPRGLPKRDETWDAWWPDLGPSRDLHADFYGKHGAPIGWSAYRKRYLAEMRRVTERLNTLADRVRRGETITLLCSSACTDPTHCHRTLLADLIAKRAAR